MPLDFRASVRRNDDLGQGNYLLEFDAPDLAATMRPAQFFMIGIPGAETLLRRPYSVCGLPGTFEGRSAGAVQVLYKAVGRGTRLLASLAPGATVEVLGPLGNGFVAPADPALRPLFVAGGIGSAPFPALAASLAREGAVRPWMIYGARSAGDLPLREWFAARVERLELATEDGTLGHHGRVTGPLAEILSGSGESFHVYACGPEPMLKAVADLATRHGAICDLSLEAHMACGFGVCLGCVVPIHRPDGSRGYDRLCVEGPVMRAERLAW
jgi:dihydroorotate dehydrogenase electron transfer subunit